MALTADFKIGEYTFPRGWFMIAEANELDEAPKAIRFFGKDFALYRGESGRVVMLDAYCSHMGTHLTASTSASIVINNEQLEGDSIRCPYHGWRYNHKGEVDDIPYFDGPCPKAGNLTSYPVVEAMGAIFTWHDEEGNEPTFDLPLLDEWADPQWVNGAYDHLGELEMHPVEILDNMADAFHLGPTHGAPCEYFENEFKDHVFIQRQGGFHRMYQAYLTTLTWYTGPGMLLSKQKFGDANGYEFIFNTPIDDGVVKVWHNNLAKAPSASPSEEDVANAKMAQEGALAAFAQDFEIWRNKKPALNIMATKVEGNFKKGRIWHQQFYNSHKDVDSYTSRINGKHHMSSFELPGEAAQELESA